MTEPVVVVGKEQIFETGLKHPDALQTISYNNFREIRKAPGIHFLEAKLTMTSEDGQEFVGFDDGAYINLPGQWFGSSGLPDKSVWVERLLDCGDDGYRIRFGNVGEKGSNFEGELGDTAHIIELRGANKGQAYLVGASLALMMMHDSKLNSETGARYFVESNFDRAFDQTLKEPPTRIDWPTQEIASPDPFTCAPDRPKVTGRAIPVRFDDGSPGYHMQVETEIPSKDELKGSSLSGWSIRYKSENPWLIALCRDVAALELMHKIPTLTTQERLREVMEENGADQVIARSRFG